MRKSKGFAHILVLVLLLAGLAAGVILVQQKQIFTPKASEIKVQAQTIDSLTKQLIQKQQEYQTGKGKGALSLPEDKGKTLNAMVSIAARRQSELSKQIEKDPYTFLNQATLYQQRDSFPKEVQPYIEEKVEIKGKLVVVHMDDFKNNKFSYDYLLKTEKQRYNLYFAKNLPQVLTDSVVVARGISVGNKIAMDSGNQSNERFSLEIVTPSKSSPKGVQKTAVIMANFPSNKAELFDRSQVQAMMIDDDNSVNKYYLENSFNLTSFTTDIFGWYTIDGNPQNCYNDYWSWSDKVKVVAEKAGVNLDQYKRLVYVFATTNCGMGFGTVGGAPSETWIGGSYLTDRRVFSHELGHNLGLHHANSLRCPGLAVDTYSKCIDMEYGDVYDIMGTFWNLSNGLYSPHFNGPHKLTLGWIPDANVKTVTQDGVYTVSAIETSGSSTQVLKIPKRDTEEFYYISFRQAVGFDKGLPEGIIGGASIHIWNDQINETPGGYFDTVQTKLIDNTPGTASYDLNSANGFNDAALQDNATFIDPGSRVIVKQLSHDQSSATVEIKMVPLPSISFLGDWQSQTPIPKGSTLYGPSGLSVISENYLFRVANNNSGISPYIAKVNNGTLGSWSLPKSRLNGYKPTISTILIPNGQSLISLPQISTSVDNAASLLKSFNSQGIKVSKISRWINGGWDSHIFNFPANSFPLKKEEGYTIQNDGPAKTYILSDASLTTAFIPQDIGIEPGFNLIGFPLTKYYDYLAEDLISELNIADNEISEIRKLEPQSGRYITHSAGSSENNFPIKAGEGYFVKSNARGQLPLPDKNLNSYTVAEANGYIYILSSYFDYATYTTAPVVYLSRVNTDGSLAGWQQTASFPKVFNTLDSVVVGNFLYVSGTYWEDGFPSQKVYFSRIGTGGTLGNWSATTSLPSIIDSYSLTSSGQYIYVTGGFDFGQDGRNVTTKGKVYFAKANSDGTLGSWQETTILPQALYSHSSVVYEGYLVVTGGQVLGKFRNSILAAKINSDGTLGNWILGGTLPTILSGHSMLSSNNYLWIIGGRANYGPSVKTIYSAALQTPVATDPPFTNPTPIYTPTPTSSPTPTPAAPTGILGSWTNTSADLPELLVDHALVSSEDMLFNIGGDGDSGYTYKIYVAKVGSNGSIVECAAGRKWCAIRTLPQVLYHHSALVFNGYLYVTGTVSSSGASTALGGGGGGGKTTTFVAKINHWNEQNLPVLLDSWVEMPFLPKVMSNHASVIYHGYLYILGGTDWNGQAQTDVYFAKIKADGTLEPWQQSSTSLPRAIYSHSAAVTTDGFVYILGGYGVDINGGSAFLSSVYVARIDSNSGAISSWTQLTTPLPKSVYNSVAVVNGSYIMLLGGYSGTSERLNSVYTAKTKADGGLENWFTSTALPRSVRGPAAAIVGSNLFFSGGRTSSGRQSAVYSAPIQISNLTQASSKSSTTGSPAPAPFTCTPQLGDVTKDKKINISDISFWSYCRIRGIGANLNCKNADLDKDGKVGNGSLNIKEDPEYKCISSQFGKNY